MSNLKSEVPLVGPERPHSEICRCSICMRSKISAPELSTDLKGLQATMVDRRSPEDSAKPLMKAIEAHGIIRAGTTVDLMKITGIAQEKLPKSNPIVPVEPDTITISAQWRNKNIEKAKSGGVRVFLAP